VSVGVLDGQAAGNEYGFGWPLRPLADRDHIGNLTEMILHGSATLPGDFAMLDHVLKMR